MEEADPTQTAKGVQGVENQLLVQLTNNGTPSGVTCALGEGIAGHVASVDEATGKVQSIALDASYDGPRYFVPSEPQPAPLTITAFGQMANDLAVGDLSKDIEPAEYAEASEANNLLVLVFRLERDASDARVLVPTRPISTLAKSITFVNDVPMELGCKYGQRFWSNWRDAENLRACLEAPDASRSLPPGEEP